MKISPLPHNEKERLEALKRYEILDTEPEGDFNDIVELASQICNTPIALITLLDETRQWFKAKTGIGINETHRDLAFCAHTIHENDIMLVPDASKDERFFDNPLVTQDPKIQFYAGVPLITNTGFKLGSLCVIDHKTKNLTKKQLNGLRILGKQVINLLDLRLMNLKLKKQIQVKTLETSNIFDRISDAFITFDFNWRITYVNKSGTVMWRKSFDELLGANLWDTYPTLAGSATERAFRKAMEDRQASRVEDYYEPFNIWFEAHIYPSPEGLSVFIRDISVRKKIENEIKASESRYRSLIEQAADAILVAGEDGHYTDVNESACQLFGYTKEEFLTLSVHDLLFEHDAKTNPLRVAELKEGKHVCYERKMKKRNGTGVEVEVSGRMVQSGMYLIFIRDITDRKRNEDALREAEEHYRSIFENALIGIYQSTPGGRFMLANPAMANMLGYDSPEELVNSISNIGNQLYADKEERHRLKNLLKQHGQAMGYEFRVLKKNGGVIWVRDNVRVVYESDGRIKYYEGSLKDITEQKNAEAKRRQSEERHGRVVASLAEGMMLFDHTGVIIEANKSAEKILGIPLDLLKGQAISPAWKTTGEDGQPIDVNDYPPNVALRTGEEQRDKAMKLDKPDGTPIWLSINALPLFDDDNGGLKPKWVFTTFSDITESKRAKAQIIKERDLAESVINSLPGVFYLFDSTGKYLRWNKNLETVTGYSGGEISTMHPLQLFDDDEKELLTSRIAKVFETGFGDVEANFLLKNKTKIPYYFNGWKIDYEGETCLIGVGIDISERKKAEAKSKDSENKLRAFFRSTPDSSVLLGKNFEVLAFNDAANELSVNASGQSIKEGENWLQYIFPEVRHLIKEFVEKAFQGETSQGEFPIIDSRTGKGVWWLAVFMPAYDDEGNIFAVVANSTNIDKIKRAELKLKKQFEELQKTNHELDLFVYSVSHDLRAPLASILGLINLADMEKPSPVFGNYFALIRTSVNRLDGFIKDILDYSRNSRTEVTAEKIDFQKLVAEVQDNVRLMDGAERLKTELKIDNGFDFYSDRARVSILFNNLFTNAIKYQDYRKPVSTVCIHVTLSLHQALIKFSDNGIGIDEKYLPKIFNMFYRASENSKGSGLGLYIASETLSKLGGTVKVESELGLSTIFEITIPNSPPNK